MIPVCWDEISTRHAGTVFTIRLHEQIKFHLGKVGHISTWHFFRFVHIFFLKFYRHLLAFFLAEWRHIRRKNRDETFHM